MPSFITRITPSYNINMSVVIKYNNIELTPTPFVSRSMQPIEAGALKLGFIQEYNLNGFFKVNSKDDLSALAVFSVSPAVLKIDSEPDIKVFVSSFAISDTAFDLYSSTQDVFVPYSVKFKSYKDLPQKIKSPTLECSYSEEQNRVISLSIKASAQGITSVEDARVFVDSLVDDFRPNTENAKSIILNMPSTYGGGTTIPSRVPHVATNWALVSTKKSIDRTKFTYLIERNFKRNPGGITDLNFKFSETVDISQSLSPASQGFKSYDFNVNLKILCGPDGVNVNNNTREWTEIETSIQTSNSYVQKIVDHYLTQHHIAVQSPDNIEKISFSKNESANEMTLKFTLVDCPADDFKGYFNYSVSTDDDLALEEKSVSIDGQFVSKGDISNRREWLQKWMKGSYTPSSETRQVMPQKNSSADFPKFIRTLKEVSIIDVADVFDVNKINIDHDFNKASLKISASLDNKQRLKDMEELSFNVDTKVGIPVYKFSPSANVEGHFIIQDFVCSTLETINISVNGKVSDSKDSSMKAATLLGNGIIQHVYEQHKLTNSKSWVAAVPEAISATESKGENSFDMSFSAIVKGVDYNLSQLMKNNNTTPGISRSKRFGK